MKLGNPFSGAQLLRFGVVATLATGVLATAAGRGTLAYFTTQVTSGSNTFTAGNLHFTISDNNETATAPSVATRTPKRGPPACVLGVSAPARRVYQWLPGYRPRRAGGRPLPRAGACRGAAAGTSSAIDR